MGGGNDERAVPATLGSMAISIHCEEFKTLCLLRVQPSFFIASCTTTFMQHINYYVHITYNMQMSK